MKKNLVLFFLLPVLVFSIYSNSLKSEWHFDDLSNITENTKIQISSLSLEDLKNSLFSESERPEKLYRPISCLSFAINAFFSGTDTFGYHITNVFLHILTAIALFHLLQTIFSLCLVDQNDKNKYLFISYLATFLWAVHPIQTQAVTYIVQRMTIFAALFSILSMTTYLKGRISNSATKKSTFFCLCAVFYLLAILSKENGVITLFSLLLLEFIFFRKIDLNQKSIKLILLILIFFSSLLLYSLHIFGFKLSSLLNYSQRHFTLFERLLTEPRVIFFYLSLIFYPSPDRFSIEHDFVISNGFLSPPSTLVCISGIVFLFLYGIKISQKNKLLSLSILFFLINHSVESSFIPLEIVFEHRNYLPSIFIFASLSQITWNSIEQFNKNNRFIHNILSIFIVLIFLMICMSTYIRNYDWQTEKSLWEDAAKKAPGSPRVWHNLAFDAEKKGDFESAWINYNKALSLQQNIQIKINLSSIYANIGNLYFFWKNDIINAHRMWDLAIEQNPNHFKAYYAKASAYMKEKEWLKALNILKLLSIKAPYYDDILKDTGICNINTKNFNEARDAFANFLRKNPDDPNAILNLAESLSLSGHTERADFFLRCESVKRPNHLATYIALSKNYFINGNKQKAKEYIEIFFRKSGLDRADIYLRQIYDNKDEIPMIGISSLEPLIQDAFIESKNKLKLTIFDKHLSILE